MDNANNSEFYTTTAMLPQQLPLAAVLLLSVPAFLIILLTIFGNLLVLLFKARVGRTNTTLLVWNLGLTDFLVGVFVLPLGAIYLINRRWTLGHLLCRIWVCLSPNKPIRSIQHFVPNSQVGADVTFCTCSVVTICIISVDRYLAVTRPLRYKSVVTKLKVAIAIILIWAFSLGILLVTVRWDIHPKTRENKVIIAFLGFYQSFPLYKTCFVGDEIRYLAHSVVFAFFLPASVTLTLYWRIYSLARDRQRALDRGFIMILGHNMNFLTNTLSQTVEEGFLLGIFIVFSVFPIPYRQPYGSMLASTMGWLSTNDECYGPMNGLPRHLAWCPARFCFAGSPSSPFICSITNAKIAFRR